MDTQQELEQLAKKRLANASVVKGYTRFITLLINEARRQNSIACDSDGAVSLSQAMFAGRDLYRQSKMAI